jgi:hypothetical protein
MAARPNQRLIQTPPRVSQASPRWGLLSRRVFQPRTAKVKLLSAQKSGQFVRRGSPYIAKAIAREPRALLEYAQRQQSRQDCPNGDKRGAADVVGHRRIWAIAGPSQASIQTPPPGSDCGSQVRGDRLHRRLRVYLMGI